MTETEQKTCTCAEPEPASKAEARKRLVELVTADILAAGWKIKSVHQSRKKSVYIKCSQGKQRLTVRIADHPPVNLVGCSIHPGGDTRKTLLRKLSPVVPYFFEWLDS